MSLIGVTGSFWKTREAVTFEMSKGSRVESREHGAPQGDAALTKLILYSQGITKGSIVRVLKIANVRRGLGSCQLGSANEAVQRYSRERK